MRLFDLEAAKRGEPICYADGSQPPGVTLYFIGVNTNGDAVYERSDRGGCLHETPVHRIAMAPRKVVRYVVLVARELAAGAFFSNTCMHKTPPIPACADSVVARVEWEE